MTDPVSIITDAKDGYQLSLAMLSIILLGFSWFIIKYFEITKNQDIKDTENNLRIDKINKDHSNQIDKIHAEHSSRIERLIESHRVEVSTTLDKLTATLHELHIAIEKRVVSLRNNES